MGDEKQLEKKLEKQLENALQGSWGYFLFQLTKLGVLYGEADHSVEGQEKLAERGVEPLSKATLPIARSPCPYLYPTRPARMIGQ